MKHILGSISIIAALASSSAVYAANSNTATGTINFTGSITDTSCEVKTINGNSASTAIDFGQIAAASLSNDGDLSGTKEFTIVMDKCPASISAADISFAGTTVAGRDDLYALNFNSGTPNISTTAGLLLKANPDTSGYVNTLSGLLTIDLSQLMVTPDGSTQSTITLPLQASIQRIGSDALEAGAFTSAANFTMTYQ